MTLSQKILKNRKKLKHLLNPIKTLQTIGLQFMALLTLFYMVGLFSLVGFAFFV
jgi:hypothetical protein